jgi:hypothetical protein
MAPIVQSHIEPAESTRGPDPRPISDKPVVSEQGIPRGIDVRG